MEAYFVRDKDSWGGTLEVHRAMPILENERLTIQEVRKGEFPADTWLQIFMAEIKPDSVTHFDTVIQPYFDKAVVIWTREGGAVNNGTE